MKGAREVAKVYCDEKSVALMHDPIEMGESMGPPLNVETMFWARCANSRTGKQLEETRRISDVVEWFGEDLAPGELAEQLRGKETDFANVLARLGDFGIVAGLPQHPLEQVERRFGIPEAKLVAHIEGDAIVFFTIDFDDDLVASLTGYSIDLSTGLVTVKGRLTEA